MADRPDGKKKPGCTRIFVIFFRFTAMCMVLIMVIGLIGMWRFPGVAKRNDVDLTHLMMRTIDTHTLDPLHYLQDDRVLADITLDLANKEVILTTKIAPTEIAPRKFVHQVKDAGGPDAKLSTLESTTPHTRIPVEQLKLARDTLDRIFTDADPVHGVQLDSWGETMFVIWWETMEKKPKSAIKPEEGNEDEHRWFVWRRLEAGMTGARKDLTRLPEMLKHQYPRAEDREAALKWASDLYDNLELVSKYHVHESNTKLKDARKKLTLTYTLPPKTDWVLAWLLYTHVGLDKQSREEAAARWWGAFREDRPDIVLAWGKEIRDERQQHGEALPPGGDDVTLLCAAQRLTGTDAYGIRCRKAFWEAMDEGKGNPSALQLATKIGCFPNDDLYYVGASGDQLEVVWELSDVGARLARIMIFFILMWGINGWVFNLLGNRILRLSDNDVYTSFRDKHRLSRVPPKVFLAYALTPLLGWGLACAALPLSIGALISPARLLVEVYVSVLMGGILFVLLSQTVAVLLIRFGIDPEKTFLDEFITIPLGIFILLHFGNEVWSIVSFVALSVIPETILRFHEDDPGKNYGKTTRWLIGIGIAILFIGVGVNSEKKRKPKSIPPTAIQTSMLREESPAG
jgi:hypothetical protein